MSFTLVYKFGQYYYGNDLHDVYEDKTYIVHFGDKLEVIREYF